MQVSLLPKPFINVTEASNNKKYPFFPIMLEEGGGGSVAL